MLCIVGLLLCVGLVLSVSRRDTASLPASYFPDRTRTLQQTSVLLDELMKLGFTIRELLESYGKVARILPDMELDELKGKLRWAQVGVVRTVLDLTNDEYWQMCQQFPPPEYRQIVDKWRALLRGKS